MTVNDLRDKLAEYPGDMRILIRDGDFGLSSSIKVFEAPVGLDLTGYFYTIDYDKGNEDVVILNT